MAEDLRRSTEKYFTGLEEVMPILEELRKDASEETAKFQMDTD
jgi:hypothetical protein